MKQNYEANLERETNKGYGGRVNYVTEFLFFPNGWKLDDPRYTWLTPEDRKILDGFDFDYGDILDSVKHHNSMEMTAALLMTDQKQLDHYCQTLWRKPWDVVYGALRAKTKNEYVDRVFSRWAEEGSGVALNVMKDVTQVAQEENDKKANGLTIRLVSDIEEER